MPKRTDPAAKQAADDLGNALRAMQNGLEALLVTWGENPLLNSEWRDLNRAVQSLAERLPRYGMQVLAADAFACSALNPYNDPLR